ncbi:MAG TPA: DegT/DnrJ/EryC1/StrS family aminotransferase, partial [Spirochaetota bacterium]|nr:DegT/DnrJ/EryC1/StrS family aminotransferase [Spirochaetota bacterium]
MSIVSSKPTITRKELESVLDCLISERLDPGEAVKNLEIEIANLTGVRHALAVNSLTSAYHLAFLAFDIRPGDEVIIPSYFDPAAL